MTPGRSERARRGPEAERTAPRWALGRAWCESEGGRPRV